MNVRTARLVFVLVAVVAVLLVAGCDMLSGWSSTQSVSDPNNLFHFKVPSDWLVSSEQGVVTVYAGDTLPDEGDQQELALLVMSSTDASETPVPEMISYLVNARAKSRGWTQVEMGKAVQTTVGGRAGTYIDVSAKNAEGKQFDGRYVFVRTGKNEAFVAAIAPSGKAIRTYSKDLENIAEQWYWHGAEGGSPETTSSAGD